MGVFGKNFHNTMNAEFRIIDRLGNTMHPLLFLCTGYLLKFNWVASEMLVYFSAISPTISMQNITLRIDLKNDHISTVLFQLIR